MRAEKIRFAKKEPIKKFSIAAAFILMIIVASVLFSLLMVISQNVTAQQSTCFTIKDSPRFADMPVEVGDPMPILKVTFNKPVANTSMQYALYNSKYEKIQLDMLNVSDDSTVYRFKPQKQLAETVYKFTIQGMDLRGNCGEYKEQDFRIKVQPISITLLNPPYGASNQQKIDLIIRTNRNSEQCKYYSGDRMNFEDIIRPENIFAKIGDREHKIADFGLVQGGKTVKIVCNDSYGYINNDVPREFYLFYDPTIPNIKSFSANPGLVVEGANVTLIIDIDDEAICKYDNETILNTDNSTTIKSYENMTFSFPAANSLNFTTHDEAVLYLAPDYTGNYPYYAGCMNRAQLTSMTGGTSFTVNWNAADAILDIKPTGIILNNSPIITVSTNRKAKCYLQGARLITEEGISHSLQKYLDAEGIYPYQVDCQFGMTGTTLSKTFSFIYDTTPPIMINVSNIYPKSENPCCVCPNMMYGTWTANESLSGITQYNYTIINTQTGEEIKNWTATQDSQVLVTGLGLIEDNIYGLKVRAQNGANLWSDWILPDGYAGVIAALRYCNNGTITCTDGALNGNETDTDCGGTCELKCGVGKICYNNTDCNSQLCLLLTTGIEKRCAKPYCENGLQSIETKETDIDCGGMCGQCDDSKRCLINDDCRSLHCVEGLCAAPICNDGIKNGQETGMDCGGTCNPCKVASCASGDVCVPNCYPPDPDCQSNENATCWIQDGCKLDCSIRDPDCPTYGPSCGAKDGCVAVCSPPDSDCENYPDPCKKGNVCAINCQIPDPDCSPPSIPTCAAKDGCKQGCNPLDPDCDALTCDKGNICIAECSVIDIDCGKATCEAGDGCSLNCVVADPDCNINSTATCGKGDGCKWNCPTHDPDCLGKSSCAKDDGCVAGCLPLDPDCGDYFTCTAGNGCMLGCQIPDPDCNNVVGYTCAKGDGCNPMCSPKDPDCGGYTCFTEDGCVFGCNPPDQDCIGVNCSVQGDCSSGICSKGKCALSQCTDGVLNGKELGIDCGGPDCSSCDIGKKCNIDLDCKSDYCEKGMCADSKKKDSNRNGIPDYWENQYFCKDTMNGVCVNANDDPDKDGLTNLQEYQHKTDPLNKDTDGDGATDGQEVNNKPDPTDPTNPADKPPFPIMMFMIPIIILIVIVMIIVIISMSNTKKKKAMQTQIPLKPMWQGAQPPIRSQLPGQRTMTPEQIRQMQLHHKFISSMKEKQKKRTSALSAFDEETKPETSDKGKKAEEQTTRVETPESTSPAKKPEEWLSFEPKSKQKLAAKTEASPASQTDRHTGIFDKLSSVGKKQKKEATDKKTTDEAGDIFTRMTNKSKSKKGTAITELEADVKKEKETKQKRNLFEELDKTIKRKK